MRLTVLSCSRGVVDGDIQCRIKREPCGYLGVETTETTHMMIRILTRRTFPNRPAVCAPSEWRCTVWTRACNHRSMQLARLPRVNSSYTRHTGEVARFARYGENAYTFANTFTWLDARFQILLLNDWAPECAAQGEIDLDTALFLGCRGRLLFRGFTFGTRDWAGKRRRRAGRHR